MQLIETNTLATTAAQIDFTSIPQTFTDLVLVISGRSDRALEVDGVSIRFNADTTNANYSGRRLTGDGSGAGSDTTYLSMPWMTGANATADTFGNATLYICNYTGSSSKSFSIDGVAENNATRSDQGLGCGLYTPTTAITQVRISSETANTLQIGTTISLYGILKGSDGIVTTS